MKDYINIDEFYVPRSGTETYETLVYLLVKKHNKLADDYRLFVTNTKSEIRKLFGVVALQMVVIIVLLLFILYTKI